MNITDGAGFHVYIPDELIGKQIVFKGRERGKDVRGVLAGRIADPFTLEIVGSGSKVTLYWADRSERNKVFDQLVPKAKPKTAKKK